MLTDEKRLFVGNIPPGVTENDLRSEFSAYGSVKNVELKTKENLVDPDNPNLFAFVNLEIDDSSVKQCIDEFSRETYRGRYLTVSVARESFLDRLKRERAEASKTSENNLAPKEVKKIPIKKVVQKPPVQIEVDKSEDDSSSSEDSEESEDEAPAKIARESNEVVNDAETLFIAKKRASSSLLNGKIKIQQVNTDPIHVITKNQKHVKRLDDKAQQADQKRKESLSKMKNQYNQQKLAIQKALATVDSQAQKKIVFDDDTEMMNGDVEKPASKKISLFEDNDDEDDDEKNYGKDFEIKNHLLSAGGEKLIRLQSRFKLDPRFQMDERFLEHEVDDDANATQKSKDEILNDDERKWQLGIIEQVVGRKLESLSEPNRSKLRKTMLRFDPLKEEHQKFLTNVQVVAESIKEDEGDKVDEKEESGALNEQFYTINEDLSQTLKRRGEGFSLLSMFGRAEDADNNNKQNLNDVYQEKPILNNALDKSLNNPFNFDSSDSEDETQEKLTKVPKVQSQKEKKVKTGGKETKMGVWTENFFMFGKDERLKEGSTFFTAVKQKDTEEPVDYDEVKAKMKVIINQKIRKTKKNLKGPKAGFNKFKRKT